MLSSILKHRISFSLLITLFVCGATLALAQSTEFTYQGNLVENSIPANGNYDFEFRLFAVSTDGTPIGTRTRLNVPVTNGGFTVRLDFSPAAFNGADRFLEITVKPAASPNPFTMLSPRQQITYAPYSFHSLNADVADTATRAEDSLQLGGITANQYVLTGDARLSDARPPTAGSSNYIQSNPGVQQSANFNINGNGIVGGNLTVNGTLTANLPAGDGSYIQNRTSQQIGIVNFNIQGSGTVGGTVSASTVSATTQYNLTGNNRILGIGPSDSLFVGLSAGANNDTGNHNSFFGRNAGLANTNGDNNSFFGSNAGVISVGSDNAFFGYQAGGTNTTGVHNAYFGSQAGNVYAIGFPNSTGGNNAFFGYVAGGVNTSGNNNTFIGSFAGLGPCSFAGCSGNTSGSDNTYIGGSGGGQSTGDGNTFVGQGAGFYVANGNFNTAVGSVSGSGGGSQSGNYNTVIGYDAQVAAGLTHATAIGAEAYVSFSNTIMLGRSDGSDFVRIPGLLTIPNLAVAGIEHLCRNSNDRVGNCSSSLRYKTNLQPFTDGLNTINRLRPIAFTWKDGGMRDVGFGAEDVEKIEPLFVTYNKAGNVEGVKYDRINVVLVNAIKEQQVQIQTLQDDLMRQQQLNEQLKWQQDQIDGLKKLVCAANPTAELCRK